VKPHPPLICVTGLKNSGKTTACTALISGLRSRGYRVAALKSSHVASLRLDHRDTDSYALAESGAEFVLVQGPEESLILERGGRTFRQMIRRVPRDLHFIISEGGDARAAAAVVVCLSDPAEWERALEVRRVPREKILAVTGRLLLSGSPGSSRGSVPGSGGRRHEGLPLIDSTTDEGKRNLVEGVLRATGATEPG
jgi:molybdopterin-guanine dinucleotide biosynthesis protein MobB